jgi:hypothetical protein
MMLPSDLAIAAAETADIENPANRPPVAALASVGLILSPEYLAVMRTKYWGAQGVRLTVGFIESTPTDLRNRIIDHMNEWDKYCNAQFAYSATDPDVRITRSGQGYWSYLGTDIRHIPRMQPTMCLQGFTMSTSEKEFRRVVRHETGHTLGFPHEHMRRQIIARIDEQKCIAYFQQTQGWSAQMTRQQVLTPLEEMAIIGTPAADEQSIMTYQLPGTITKDGRPIIGGNDLSDLDKSFSNSIYPEEVIPKPDGPSLGGLDLAMDFDKKTVTLRLPKGWQVLKGA